MKLFKITEKAGSDLENIWLYTFQNWSLEQADRYYELIMNEIFFLSEYPTAGSIADHILKGYRVSRVKSHLVFYKYNSDGFIVVIRILHTSMDVENKFEA
ncbi:MAG: type II toxin-antitoxin system RelE/ParE family toxin [Candidatus Delongbacteria bacterium]|jgi:toxin ParE1/3/4|nr:type II toxin-antitoxin system RelE/ParE family toxin [Candidatus Delongbacteria bacterium]